MLSVIIFILGKRFTVPISVVDFSPGEKDLVDNPSFSVCLSGIVAETGQPVYDQEEFSPIVPNIEITVSMALVKSKKKSYFHSLHLIRIFSYLRKKFLSYVNNNERHNYLKHGKHFLFDKRLFFLISHQIIRFLFFTSNFFAPNQYN